MAEDKLDHIPILDSLRGIAAISVCLFHFVCTTTGYIQNKTALSIFDYGQKGVEVFFIISGVVIPLSLIRCSYKYKSFFRFIGRRFLRIEPPYLVAVMLGIIYLIVRNKIPGSVQVDLTPSTKEILLHIGYLIPFFHKVHWINPVFWTLAIEFQYYLFLSLFFPLVMNRKIVYRILFYLFLILPSFITGASGFFPAWGPYFGIGIFYILWRTELISKMEFWIMMIITCASVYFTLGVTDLIIGAGTLAVIHFFFTYSNKIGKMLGKISYSMYLIHSIIGTSFINFMSHRFTESYQKILVIICGFLITILSAAILYYLIEKPSQLLSKKIRIK